MQFVFFSYIHTIVTQNTPLNNLFTQIMIIKGGVYYLCKRKTLRRMVLRLLNTCISLLCIVLINDIMVR